MNRILNPVRRLMNVRVFHAPLWVWLATIAGAIVARAVVSAFLSFGAIACILGSGIVLMLGGRRARQWTGRLLAYGICLEFLAVILAG